MKKVLKLFFTIAITLGIVITTQITIKAMVETELYFVQGESYKISLTATNPVLDYYTGLNGAGYNLDGVKVCTPTIKNQELTIKTEKVGTATFYVNKNGKTANDYRVRKVVVHVYPKTNTITPTVTNSITGNADGTIYCYGGKSLRLNISTSTSNVPLNVSADTSGKAKGFMLSSLYECADSAGNNIQNGVYNFNVSSPTSTYRDFVPVNRTSVTNTYMRACGYWVSSTGSSHWTAIKVLNIKIYPTPQMIINNESGVEVNSLRLTEGCDYKISGSVKNLQSNNEYITTCTSSNKSMLGVSTVTGGFNLSPNGLAVSVPLKLTMTATINKGEVYDFVKSKNPSYCTFSKTIDVYIESPEITSFYIPTIDKEIPGPTGLVFNGKTDGIYSFSWTLPTSEVDSYNVYVNDKIVASVISPTVSIPVSALPTTGTCVIAIQSVVDNKGSSHTKYIFNVESGDIEDNTSITNLPTTENKTTIQPTTVGVTTFKPIATETTTEQATTETPVIKQYIVDSSKNINLEQKLSAGQKAVYESGNSKIATVSEDGKVKLHGYGTTYITINIYNTYNNTVEKKKVKITVKAKKCSISKMKKSRMKLKIKYKADKFGKKYQVHISANKKFKKGKTFSKTYSFKKSNNEDVKSIVVHFKKKPKGTYYVRLRMSEDINGKKYKNNWSKIKKVHFK